MVSSAAGTLALMWLTASSPAGALLGGGSSAVVGGLLGFLGASFVEIVLASLRESLAAERAATRPPDGTASPSQRRS
jgi:hypothetical protein